MNVLRGYTEEEIAALEQIEAWLHVIFSQFEACYSGSQNLGPSLCFKRRCMTADDVVVKDCMEMFRAALIRHNVFKPSAYTTEIHIRRTCFKILKLRRGDFEVCSKPRKGGK